MAFVYVCNRTVHAIYILKKKHSVNDDKKTETIDDRKKITEWNEIETNCTTRTGNCYCTVAVEYKKTKKKTSLKWLVCIFTQGVEIISANFSALMNTEKYLCISVMFFKCIYFTIPEVDFILNDWLENWKFQETKLFAQYWL